MSATIQDNQTNKQVEALLLSQDAIFSSLIKQYLSSSNINITVESSQGLEEFCTKLKLTNARVDIVIVPILTATYTLENFFQCFESIYSSDKKPKILFISPILPGEETFKFIEAKNAYFMMQYNLPEMWLKKIKLIAK